MYLYFRVGQENLLARNRNSTLNIFHKVIPVMRKTHYNQDLFNVLPEGRMPDIASEPLMKTT